MPELENQGQVVPENTQPQTQPTEQLQGQPQAEPTKEQLSKALGMSVEQLEAFNRFTSGNGGFDKVFEKMKQTISNPQKQETTQPVQPTEVTPQTQPEQPKQEYKMPEGYISQTELNNRRYFNDLASTDEYKNIADEIKNGSILKTLADFDINVTDDHGNINDAKIRSFLSLYAKTRQTVQATEPEGSGAPTVNLVETGANGEVTSREMALDIVKQNMELKQMGKSHPSIEKALEFLKNNVYNS